jgi:hypothetical protein
METIMIPQRTSRSILLVLGLHLLGASALFAAGLTAKGALGEVSAAARKWQPDAVLVSLSSTSVQMDGTATEWRYSYYSPGTTKRCVIAARGAAVRVTEVRLGDSTAPLGEFIDSDKAMEEARKNGLKGDEPSMAVKLLGSGPRASSFWVVTGGLAKGDVSVILDAKTGKFSSRNTVD